MIDSKKCPCCEKELPYQSFSKDRRSKNGLQVYCKICHRMKNSNCPSLKIGTLSGFKRRTWGILNSRTVNGGHPQYQNKRIRETYLDKGIKLFLTKEQFYLFCDKNEKEILNLYSSFDKPSIDRIDANGHYSLDNIQVLSLNDNRKKGQQHKAVQSKKPIIATEIGTGKTRKYDSAQSATEDGFSYRKISKVCLGQGSTHKGWRFEFA